MISIGEAYADAMMIEVRLGQEIILLNGGLFKKRTYAGCHILLNIDFIRFYYKIRIASIPGLFNKMPDTEGIFK